MNWRMPYFPRWLYEALPFIYFACGVWAGLTFQSGVAFVSSLLLFFAGALVLYLRWNHRTRKEVTNNEEEVLVNLSWKKTHECEHEIIDTQHRELFIAFHRLFDAAMEKQADRFNDLVRDFIQKLDAHFRDEEAILRKSNPAIASDHAKEHQVILSRAGTLFQHYQQGKIRRAALTGYLMNEALVSHIEDDLKQVKQAFWGE